MVTSRDTVCYGSNRSQVCSGYSTNVEIVLILGSSNNYKLVRSLTLLVNSCFGINENQNSLVPWHKNGIRDACSTADCCPCCPLFSIVVHCWALLSIVVIHCGYHRLPLDGAVIGTFWIRMLRQMWMKIVQMDGYQGYPGIWLCFVKCGDSDYCERKCRHILKRIQLPPSSSFS